jgi:NDMA-dependent alcohol dehydrogenase
MAVKIEAALLWGLNEPWSVEEVELDGPAEGEVLVKVHSVGLCRTSDHLSTGIVPFPYPAVGGHEGAGVIEEVGEGVRDLEPGDHVVLLWEPACGKCKWCIRGHTNLCDLGANIVIGPQLDGTCRVHARGEDVNQEFLVGAFSPYTVAPAMSVCKIDEDIPLGIAGLFGCSVTCGWGSAVRTGKVEPGDTVVVMGVGGVGSNAVQGARCAGAQHIVAIDPVPFKRENAERLGATHVCADYDEAWETVSEITRGQLADKALLCTNIVETDYVTQALSLVGKLGHVVMAGIPRPEPEPTNMPLWEMLLYQKQLSGHMFGGCNPQADIPMLIDMYRRGQLVIDDLVTRTYRLGEINDGYADLNAGKNIRGMLTFA